MQAGGTVRVEGCGSDSLQGDVRFAEVMGLMGATVQWEPHAITITGAPPHRTALILEVQQSRTEPQLCCDCCHARAQLRKQYAERAAITATPAP